MQRKVCKIVVVVLILSMIFSLITVNAVNTTGNFKQDEAANSKEHGTRVLNTESLVTVDELNKEDYVEQLSEDSGTNEDCLRYEINGEEVTITGCDISATGELIIPESIGGFPVTRIGDRAFVSCYNLTNVIVPEGVISIGQSAFESCHNLGSINIPDSVTSIGEDAFFYCSGLTTLNIPSSVTYIGFQAFSGCTGLAAINVGAENKYYCSIDGVLYNKDITTLMLYPACKSSDTYIMPKSITMIDYRAFESCNLKSINITDGVTIIEDWTFLNCNSLSINIPNSVTSISDSAFSGCSSLNEINVDTQNKYYCSVDGVLFNKQQTILMRYPVGKPNNAYTIPSGVISIGEGAFEKSVGLTSIAIPESITSIEFSAFNECTSLASITIPDSVTNIGDYAFDGCTSLECVIMYEGVTNIGVAAFRNCKSLKHVTIPNTVKIISGEMFWRCYNLAGITIPEGVEKIGYDAFAECRQLTSIDIPSSVTSIGERAFDSTGYYYDSNNWIDSVLYIDNCLIVAKTTLSGDYTIRVGTTVIADYAFSNCINLTHINIPDSLTNIGINVLGNTACYNDSNNWTNGVLYIDNCLIAAETTLPGNYTIEPNTKIIAGSAFLNCNKLTSVNMPNSVISIGERAFQYCSELKNITISDSVKSICFWTFLGCYDLERITIPSSVNSIDDAAFWYCYNFSICGVEGTYAQTYAEEKNITFVALCEVVSGDVRVQLPQNDTVLGGELYVTTVDFDKEQIVLPEDTIFSSALIYDICFEKDGKKLQPEGNVKVYIRIPEHMNGENCKVFFIDENKNLIDMNAVYGNGHMVFTTDHFSYYAIVELDVPSISGIITSFGDASENTIVRLLQGTNEIQKIETIKGNYKFDNVSSGTYILEISKTNHVTKAYEISVADSDVVQDACIYLFGDVDGNGVLNSDDAIYVLYHVFYPEKYPVNQNVDFDDNDSVASDDAIHLLNHTISSDD